MPSVLPPRPFTRTLLVRVAVVWLCLHVAMSIGSIQARVPSPQAIVGTPLTALWLAAATVLVLWVLMSRERELVFLGNLGYAFRDCLPIVATECALLELGLRLLLA